LRFFTRELIDEMHRGDFTPEQFAAVCARYEEYLATVRRGFTPGVATLADSAFHDCTVTSLERDRNQVRLTLEGFRYRRNSGTKKRGVHRIMFDGARLAMEHPLAAADWCEYEELTREGGAWAYSLILATGQLKVVFSDCAVKSDR